MKNATLLLILILLSGCATVTTVEEIGASSWKKVAFVVHSGNMLRGSKVGTTAFNNSYVDWIVPDLDLDSIVSDSIVPALKSRDRWTIVDSGDFVADFKNQQEPVFNAYSKLKVSPEYLQSVSDAGYNGLIIYLPNWSYDDLGNTNQGYSGVGVYHRSFAGINSSWFVSVGKIHLYDLERPEIPAAVFTVKATLKASDNITFAKTWDELPEGTQDIILNSVSELIKNRFPEKMKELLGRIQLSDTP